MVHPEDKSEDNFLMQSDRSLPNAGRTSPEMNSIQECSDSELNSGSSDQELEHRLTPGQTCKIVRPGYMRSINKQGLCAMRKRRRVVSLDYYTRDLFTSLVDSRWRYILFIFTLSFLGSWFFFALFWWAIAYAHGDLKISPYNNTDAEPCVTLVEDMTSSFLFSLETQYTTGYGTRSPTVECPEAIFLLCLQSIFGMLLQSVMVGVVFAKLSRPKGRSQAILFSEKAVLCMRDGGLHLMVRIADVRRSHLIGCKVQAWFLQHRVSPEGEILPNFQTKLKVSIDNGGSELFLLWPVTVVHRIDSSSPFYDLSAVELFTSEFEVVVNLVCTAETTGQTTEARRSYTPTEILWGHRFQPLVKRETRGLQVDYALFEKTTPVDTPLCSARQLHTWSQPTTPISPKDFGLSPWTQEIKSLETSSSV